MWTDLSLRNRWSVLVHAAKWSAVWWEWENVVPDDWSKIERRPGKKWLHSLVRQRIERVAASCNPPDRIWNWFEWEKRMKLGFAKWAFYCAFTCRSCFRRRKLRPHRAHCTATVYSPIDAKISDEHHVRRCSVDRCCTVWNSMVSPQNSSCQCPSSRCRPTSKIHNTMNRSEWMRPAREWRTRQTRTHAHWNRRKMRPFLCRVRATSRRIWLACQRIGMWVDWSSRPRIAVLWLDICGGYAAAVTTSAWTVSPFQWYSSMPCTFRRGIHAAQWLCSNGPCNRPQCTAAPNTRPFRCYSRMLACQTQASQMNWPMPVDGCQNVNHTIRKSGTNSNRWRMTERTWWPEEIPATRTWNVNHNGGNALHRPIESEKRSMEFGRQCMVARCCVWEMCCWTPMFVCAPNCILRLKNCELTQVSFNWRWRKKKLTASNNYRQQFPPIGKIHRDERIPIVAQTLDKRATPPILCTCDNIYSLFELEFSGNISSIAFWLQSRMMHICHWCVRPEWQVLNKYTSTRCQNLSAEFESFRAKYRLSKNVWDTWRRHLTMLNGLPANNVNVSHHR